MEKASVTWCLVPPNLVFQKGFHREIEHCVQTEKFVWVVHFTITTFHLLAFFFTCLYLPPSSFSPVSKHLLLHTLNLLFGLSK